MKKKTYITPVAEKVFLYESLCQVGFGGSGYNDEEGGNFSKSQDFVDEDDDAFKSNFFDDSDDESETKDYFFSD